MIPNNLPLRYRISTWLQLKHCRSNLSKSLRIEVNQFVNSSVLTGTRIAVVHELYGTLFACLVDAYGSLVQPDESGQVPELTPETIINELYKFGFNVVYRPASSLSGDQLSYLMTLKGLGYDKIRVLPVNQTDNVSKVYIVAFQPSALGNWLNSGYASSVSEFTAALNAGTACNLTDISRTKKFDWSWLTGWVANIDDILAEAAEVTS